MLEKVEQGLTEDLRRRAAPLVCPGVNSQLPGVPGLALHNTVSTRTRLGPELLIWRGGAPGLCFGIL